MKIETCKADPDHILTTEGITGQVIPIPIEATLDHNTGIDAATIGAAHYDLTQSTEATGTDHTMTHCTSHITDHPHIEALGLPVMRVQYVSLMTILQIFETWIM